MAGPPRLQVFDSDVQDPKLLRPLLAKMLNQIYSLMGEVQTLRKDGTAGGGSGSGILLTERERSLLRSLSVGSAENPIAAQRPVFPTVTALPPVSTSTTGEAVRLDSSGIVYIFDGSDWVEIGAAAASHDLLSATHGDTLASPVVLGDILYGNSTPEWTVLIGYTGTAKRWLRQTGDGVDSAPPAWDQPASTDLSDSSALPLVVATYTLTGRTTALPATTIYTTPAGPTHLYILAFQLVITTAGTGGTIQVDITSTDRFGTLSDNGVGGTAATTINARTRNCYVIYSAANSAIQLATTFTGVTGTPAYAIDAAVIRLS